jgi:hypothetical protein
MATPLRVVNPHTDDIDSLAYIDHEYESHKVEVDLLLKSEMHVLAKELASSSSATTLQHYLDKLPPAYEPFKVSTAYACCAHL